MRSIASPWRLTGQRNHILLGRSTALAGSSLNCTWKHTISVRPDDRGDANYQQTPDEPLKQLVGSFRTNVIWVGYVRSPGRTNHTKPKWFIPVGSEVEIVSYHRPPDEPFNLSVHSGAVGVSPNIPDV